VACANTKERSTLCKPKSALLSSSIAPITQSKSVFEFIRMSKEYIDLLTSGICSNKFQFELDLLSKKYFLTKIPPNVPKIQVVLAISEKKVHARYFTAYII
jgi:hypothetical protein